jgi:uncharacterized protein YxjI
MSTFLMVPTVPVLNLRKKEVIWAQSKLILFGGRFKMKKLHIKQKVFSLSGKFTVKDEQEKDVYYVEGSFMQIPKTFSIMNTTRDEVALITKKAFSFLPKFFVEVNGQEVLTFKKEFTFLKARYTIDSEALKCKVIGGTWIFRYYGMEML